MATITFTMSDEILARAVAAYSERYDLDAVGGETRGQFAKRMLAADVKARIVDYEARMADAAVRAAAGNVTITADTA